MRNMLFALSVSIGRYAFLVLFFCSSACIGQAKLSSADKVTDQLMKISTTPEVITISNSIEVNNRGGHLQGIQQYLHQGKKYIFVSGSSDTYSYYAVSRLGKVSAVISVNKLLNPPFRHAGGFQIYEDWMAIGIEDNYKKDRSSVFVYPLVDPERLIKEPAVVIERAGTSRRATAGCVGITRLKESLLVAVGDWDTRHIDFYLINPEALDQDKLITDPVNSIDSRTCDKSNWINGQWESYQNINFLKVDDQLFLAGFASAGAHEILDLFTVHFTEAYQFSMQKIYTKNFDAHQSTRFRWGAGLFLNTNGEIELLSCGENIGETTVISVYK